MKKILLPLVGCSAHAYALSGSKIRFLMRASCFIALSMAISLQLAAFATSGQGLDNEITIEFKHTTLSEALRVLQNKTDMPMVYAPDLVKGHNDINVSNERRTVRAILEIILKGTNITYAERNNAIVLRLKPKPELRNIQESGLSTAQPIYRLSGKVTDAVTGETLTGVSVIVKGTIRGTTSDSQGTYSIEVNTGEVLLYSFIGYKSFETEVDDRTSIDVQLIQDATALQEVQIISTNYFSTSKEKSTMNISKVDGDEIQNQPVTSIMSAVIGRMPGVDVTPVNGAPGSAPIIQIRGVNSLTGTGSYPLYVVDGVQIESRPIQSSSSAMYGQGIDPLSGISPASIESIEVLKDAAATAIYGSRGANGVIRITTNRAKEKSTRGKFDLTTYSGIGQLANEMKLLNREQYLQMRHEAFRNNGTSPNPNSATYADITGVWDTTRSTNWQKVLLGEKAKISDVQLGFSGGNGSTTFRLAGGYHKETTIFPGDFDYQRGTADFSLNHISEDKKLEIAAGINFGWAKNRSYSSLSLTSAALTLPPVAPKLRNDDGSLNWQLHKFGAVVRDSWVNPLADLLNTYLSTSNTTIASGTISYQIVPGLKVKSLVSYSGFENDEESIKPISAVAPRLRPFTTGSAFFYRNNRKAFMFEPQFTYEHSFKNHHEINSIVGATYQQSLSVYDAVQGTGYVSDALLGSIKGAAESIIVGDERSQYKYVSLYAHIGYSFKGKYLIDLTGRRDGSSRFGPGKKYGNFGAIGAGWIFSEEALIKNHVSVISFGKFRGSYGITGNDQIGDYQYLDTYEIISSGYQNSVSLNPTALFNPNFAWETTSKLEIAAELGFFKNRVMLETSWYRNRSTNQLVNYRLSATTGFEGILRNLDATIENSGTEISLTTRNFIKSNFTWSTTFNLSIPRNVLKKFDGIEDSPYATAYKVGEPLSIQRLFKYKGVNPETGRFEIVDRDEDGSYGESDRFFMNPLGRTSYAGITNTISLLNFDLSFLVQISNNPIFSYGPFGTPGGRSNQPVAVMNRWRNDGDRALYQKFYPLEDDSFYYASQSDFAVTDGSFIRLKTLSLGYHLSKRLLEGTHLQDVRIYIQGQNLLTVTDYEGWDPETGNSGLPPLRIISAGLALKL